MQDQTNPVREGKAQRDTRRLERTGTPGIYRRHANGCKGNGRCKCGYTVRWKQGGRSHKQMFPTFELAREFKGTLDSGKSTRRPLSSTTVADYHAKWLPAYRGRTARGLDDSTRREYEASFRLHILPLIGRMRMRDLAAPDVRDWLSRLERRGASPTTIRKAKAALSVMLACAAEDGDLGSNPAMGVRYVPTEQAKGAHPKPKRRALTADDVQAILDAMPDERWRAFFMLLVQTGVRIGEALGLTWGNVHLGDDAHIMVVEQVRRGQRKRLKTESSRARVPLSPTMAAWLTELRPDDATADAPVFPSRTGAALNYSNVYHRVLQPALRDAGLDGQGIGFHSFRRACGSFLLHHGKTLKQTQGWLRHSQLTTTLNAYIQQVDDGLGGADAWDEILPDGRGHPGATAHPETAANGTLAEAPETASQSQASEQPQAAGGLLSDF